MKKLRRWTLILGFMTSSLGHATRGPEAVWQAMLQGFSGGTFMASLERRQMAIRNETNLRIAQINLRLQRQENASLLNIKQTSLTAFRGHLRDAEAALEMAKQAEQVSWALYNAAKPLSEFLQNAELRRESIIHVLEMSGQIRQDLLEALPDAQRAEVCRDNQTTPVCQMFAAFDGMQRLKDRFEATGNLNSTEIRSTIRTLLRTILAEIREVTEVKLSLEEQVKQLNIVIADTEKDVQALQGRG